MTSKAGRLRGVNLGGWLVLEKWMTPSLFTGLRAVDEHGFCEELGEKASTILALHRSSFITADDFRWIADHGLTSVRLPVGYWIFGDELPYVGGVDYVDRALGWAEMYGLRVIIDLHGAPGSQNGRDHSGRVGSIGWGEPANIKKTLQVLDRLAERYHRSPALAGIEVLNEPSWRLGKRRLRQFYSAAYETIRRRCGPDVAVIIPDAFQPRRWKRVLHGDKYQNVMLDIHLYQVFGRRDKKLPVPEHIKRVVTRRYRLIRSIRKIRPLMIGEWSAALPAEAMHGLSRSERHAATRVYLGAQLMVHNTADAWFYWSYKTERGGNWSYRDCYERGLLS